ncbi:hypothetical protein, partial [Serratia marcescens]|uniref:hypothetical protein n=1 Tax=Serratia marcescens TaxID=615 RepID=UPI00281414B5
NRLNEMGSNCEEFHFQFDRSEFSKIFWLSTESFNEKIPSPVADRIPSPSKESRLPSPQAEIQQPEVSVGGQAGSPAADIIAQTFAQVDDEAGANNAETPSPIYTPSVIYLEKFLSVIIEKSPEPTENANNEEAAVNSRS